MLIFHHTSLIKLISSLSSSSFVISSTNVSIGGVYESLGWFSYKMKLPISPEIPTQISGEIVPRIPVYWGGVNNK